MEQTFTKLQLLLNKIAKIPVVYQIQKCERVIAGVEIFQDKLGAARQQFSTHGESYTRRAQVLRDLVEQARLLTQNLDQIQGQGSLNCKIAAKQLQELQAVLEGAEGRIDVLGQTLEIIESAPAQSGNERLLALRQSASPDSKPQTGAAPRQASQVNRTNTDVEPAQPIQLEQRATPTTIDAAQQCEQLQNSGAAESAAQKQAADRQQAQITRDEIIHELQSQLKEYKNIVRLFKDQSVSDQKVIDELLSENDALKARIIQQQQENRALQERVDEAEEALGEILDKVGRI